jgi:hypothetical protein
MVENHQQVVDSTLGQDQVMAELTSFLFNHQVLRALISARLLKEPRKRLPVSPRL